MANQRRKCRLADSDHRDIDLREYEQLIIDTVNSTVANNTYPWARKGSVRL